MDSQLLTPLAAFQPNAYTASIQHVELSLNLKDDYDDKRWQ